MITKKNPYIGPRPFQKDDQDRFFGRARESNELLSFVIAHRALLLYAQSGTGKTSLLNASLIPNLRDEGFETLPVARVGIFDQEYAAIGSIANVYVYNTLISWEEDKEKLPNPSQLSLVDYLGKAPTPRVLIFDQFEELFTTYPERWRDREAFIKQLAKALENDPLLRLVLALREDYLAQLDPFAPHLPEKLRTRFRLERLRAPAALQAVKNPLRHTDRTFAEGAAEKLIDDLLKIRVETMEGESMEVAGEFIEPVQLQLVCHSLWHKMPPSDKTITESDLETFSDIDEVLADFYQEAIRDASYQASISERELRAFCEKVLITDMGTRGTVYRGKDETGGIPNSAIGVLEKKYLIRAEQRAGAHWYELTHDRFINPILKSNKDFMFKRIETSDWDQADKLFSKGQLERNSGNLSEAFDHYEEAFILFKRFNDASGQAQALYSMGEMKEKQYMYVEAIQLFTRVIELEPRESYAYLARGTARWYAGSLAEAAADFTEALSLGGDFFEVGLLKHIIHNRGQILAEMGEYQQAIEDLQLAIRLREEYDLGIDYARNGLALALGGLGEYERSFEEFERAIGEHPDNAWVYYNRALTYERIGERGKAAADYRTALEKENPPLNPIKLERAQARLSELAGNSQ